MRKRLLAATVVLLFASAPVHADAGATDDRPLPRGHWAHRTLERALDRGVREGRPGFAAFPAKPLTRYEAARLVAALEEAGKPVDWRDLAKLRAEFARELSRIGERAGSLEADQAAMRERLERAGGPAFSVETRLRHESTRRDTIGGASNASGMNLRTRVNLRYGGAEGVFDVRTPRDDRR